MRTLAIATLEWVIGLWAAVVGALMLVAPHQFEAPAYARFLPHLILWGVACLASGIGLLSVPILRPRRAATIALHAVAGLVLLAAAFTFATGVGLAVYACLGLVTLFLPAFLQRRRPLTVAGAGTTLQARLALTLALTATIALILSVAVVTAQEERLAAEQALDVQRIEAASVAQGVGDFVSWNAARLSAIATAAGLAPIEPGAQAAYLERVRLVHPDVSGFATLDPAGRLVARSGSVPLDPRAAAEVARGATSRSSSIGLRLGSDEGEGGRKVLLVSAPISRRGGRPVGVLAAAIPARTLAHRLGRAGLRVTLADGTGQEIARFDRTRRGEQVPPLPAGWDRAVAAGKAPAIGNRLASFSLLPELGWAVAVERPRAAALAGVRRGRDLAFGLLVACTLLAVGTGLVTARRIARPLGSLADAVDQVTAGNLWAPLSPSAVSEVARLSAAFRLMRDRLAARTAESERLAAELLARAEALAETDRRKDEFLAMLAHELRNPLGAIANASYLLEQTAGERAQGGREARAVAVVKRQVQHLVRMVDDLLDVSRITRGKVVLQREPVDLAEVVRQAVESTRPLIEGRGHTLELLLPPGPLPLSADLTRLEQVLANLLRNAAQFTEPGGRIAVIAEAQGNVAVVRVRDNGPGIAPELLPRVFDLFTQGEQGLDRAGAGLGIGLTLVKRLVELHGGEVAARSGGPGQGTEIVVRLPLLADAFVSRRCASPPLGRSPAPAR